MSENPYRHDHNPLNADFHGGFCSACEWERDERGGADVSTTPTPPTVAERIAEAVDDGQGSGSTGYRMAAWKPAYVTARDVCEALGIDPSARGVLLVAPHPPPEELTRCTTREWWVVNNETGGIGYDCPVNDYRARESAEHWLGVLGAGYHLERVEHEYWVSASRLVKRERHAAGRFVGVEPPAPEPGNAAGVEP